MVNGMVVVYSHYFLGPDVVVLGFHSQSPGTLVAAWTVLLEWAVVITVVAAVISVRFTQKSYLWLPTLQCSIMGATVGLLMAAWVSGSPATKGRGSLERLGRQDLFTLSSQLDANRNTLVHVFRF